MKIGMMSAWNEDSGVSIHAELIGREFVKRGYNICVFSFVEHDFHGTVIIGQDEPYVVRCFSTNTANPPFLDKERILKADYDIFIVQDLGMIPVNELASIFHLIKQRAKTLTIIHHNKPFSDPSFYQFDWDAIVCFDNRYYDFLKKDFPQEKIHIIPYPCHPKKQQDKFKARKMLNLPQDKYIFLIFGQRAVKGNLALFPVLEKISSKLPMIVLVVSKKDLDKIKTKHENKLEILIREEAPDINKLYTYLNASDVLLYHREAPDGAVVSSTVYQCLGSFCPILALRSNYLYNMEDVVFTYSNFDEFEDNVMDILIKGPRFYKWQKNVEDYLNKNSVSSIAGKYIKLFQSLLENKNS